MGNRLAVIDALKDLLRASKQNREARQLVCMQQLTLYSFYLFAMARKKALDHAKQLKSSVSNEDIRGMLSFWSEFRE